MPSAVFEPAIPATKRPQIYIKVATSIDNTSPLQGLKWLTPLKDVIAIYVQNRTKYINTRSIVSDY
jgi:hypothetical protein